MIEFLIVLALAGLVMGPTAVKLFYPKRTSGTATPPAAASAPAAPATAAATAPAAAPAATASSSNKLKWVVGVALLLVGLALVWNFPPNTWINWATTTPGQAIEKWLGVGWANWVMWLLIAFIGFGFINYFLGDKKGSKLIGAVYTGSIIAFVTVLWVGINMFYTSTNRAMEDEVRRTYFTNAPDGATEEVRARVTDTHIIHMRTAQRHLGETGTWHACPTVLSNNLNFKPRFQVVAGAYTSVNHIQMLPEDIDRLINGGTRTTWVVVLFRQTYEPDPNVNPCKHM